MSDMEPLLVESGGLAEKREPLLHSCKPRTIFALVATGLLGLSMLIVAIMWSDGRAAGFEDDISVWSNHFKPSGISLRKHCVQATASQVGEFYTKCVDKFPTKQCNRWTGELKQLLCPYLNCRAQYEIIVPGYLHCLQQRDFHHCFKKANFEMNMGCANHNDLKRKKGNVNKRNQKKDHDLCNPKYTNEVAVFYEDCLGWHEFSRCGRGVTELEKLLCPQRCPLQYSLVVPQFKRCVKNHGKNCYQVAAGHINQLCPNGDDKKKKQKKHQGTTTTTTVHPASSTTVAKMPPAKLQKIKTLARATENEIHLLERKVKTLKHRETNLVELEHGYQGPSCIQTHTNEINGFRQICLKRFSRVICGKRVSELEELLCPDLTCRQQYVVVVPNFRTCATLFGIPQCFLAAKKDVSSACPTAGHDHPANRRSTTAPKLNRVHLNDLSCVHANAAHLKTFYLSCVSGMNNSACLKRVKDLASLMCPVRSCGQNQQVVVMNFIKCTNGKKYQSCYSAAQRELTFLC